MDKLKQMETFVAVAQRGSLTAAAQADAVDVQQRAVHVEQHRLGWGGPVSGNGVGIHPENLFHPSMTIPTIICD